MLDDAEDGPGRTMPSNASRAPGTSSTRKVDFAHHALADEVRIVGCDHFSDELMAGNTGETVVTPLQFEIGIADAADEQANEGKARGTF